MHRHPKPDGFNITKDTPKVMRFSPLYLRRRLQEGDKHYLPPTKDRDNFLNW